MPHPEMVRLLVSPFSLITSIAQFMRPCADLGDGHEEGDMGRRNLVRGAAGIALAGALVSALAGCGAMRSSEAADTESLLAAAGFKRLPADTTERANALQAMTPLKVQPVTRDGRTFYVYPDPYHCKCVWVGGAKALQEYGRLRLDKQINEEHRESAEAKDTDTVMQLQPWGPGGFYMGIEE